MYVTSIDADSNTITVGDAPDLLRRSLTAGGINFVSVPRLAAGMNVSAQVRYRDIPGEAAIHPLAMLQALPVPELGIIMVNSRHARLDRELSDGDTLALFPLLGGG